MTVMTHKPSTWNSDDSILSKWIGLSLCILLMVIAANRENGAIDAVIANVLSLALIVAGMVWAVSGMEKLRRLCELYLWVAFIVSVSLLKLLTDSLARWSGTDALFAFQVGAAVHVLFSVAALWGLGAWSRKEPSAYPYITRLASGLFIVGAVVFWVGARTFTGVNLEAVSINLGGHMWTSANFMLATFITLAGLGLFTLSLREAGDNVLSVAGLFTFSFGAVFWIIHLAFRLTVIRSAAEAYARTGAAPPWYESWGGWAGLLFGIFSVLAYLSIVIYGITLLRTKFTARWIGWTCIVIGVLQAPLFGPPLFIHVVFWFVGLLILRQRDGIGLPTGQTV